MIPPSPSVITGGGVYLCFCDLNSSEHQDKVSLRQTIIVWDGNIKFCNGNFKFFISVVKSAHICFNTDVKNIQLNKIEIVI